jgi:hypothetical protein
MVQFFNIINAKQMSVIFRPLDKAIEIAESTGLGVSYAYEDLVFSDNSVFILQFDDTNKNNLLVHFNNDCEPTLVENLISVLTEKSKEKDFQLIRKGTFSLSEIEGTEELQISFYPNDIVN